MQINANTTILPTNITSQDLKKGLELLLKAAKQGNENAIEMSKMVLKASETLIN